MPVTSPGLKGIVAATTRISDVLGEQGQLIYAGYDINELAGHVSYEEVVYLLWHDCLPNKAQLEQLKSDLRAARTLPPPVVEFLKHAPKDANPMDVLRTGVSMLGLYDHAPVGNQTPEVLLPRAISLTAKVGVIVAYFHRARQGKELPPIRTDLDEAAPLPLPDVGRDAGPRDGQDTRPRLRASRRPRIQRLDLLGAGDRLDALGHLLGHRHRHRHAQGARCTAAPTRP